MIITFPAPLRAQGTTQKRRKKDCKSQWGMEDIKETAPSVNKRTDTHADPQRQCSVHRACTGPSQDRDGTCTHPHPQPSGLQLTTTHRGKKSIFSNRVALNLQTTLKGRPAQQQTANAEQTLVLSEILSHNVFVWAFFTFLVFHLVCHDFQLCVFLWTFSVCFFVRICF